MISYSDLSQTQRGLLVTGSVVGAGLLVVLLAASDFDLVPIRILRSEAVGSGGTFLETSYNPFAILVFALFGVAILAGCAQLLAWFVPKISGLALGGAQRSGEDIAAAGEKLDKELSKVLEIIRGHLTTNESYAKSLTSAQSRLANLSEGEQVRVIVTLLVAENERMRRESGEFKTRLEDSKSQIQSLRSSLTQAEAIVLKDPLTGVGNRRCFDVMMVKAIEESGEKKSALSLVMADIDHFKRVNDEFGHQVGDEIIKMFSRLVETNVREGDTVVRYGGEEFAIILPSMDQDGATAIAERIRQQFEGKKLTIRETNQKVGKMTASFGVAQFRSGDDMDLLVQRADAKLYDAKAGGRNRVATYGKID